jgi:ribosomal protein L29
MHTHWLDEVLIGPPSGADHEKRERLLAAHKEELADLRFSMILTARWEMSGGADAERRNELRAELACLRRSYTHKIDEIAMALNVRDAMGAQQEVEREVTLPSNMTPFMTSSEYDQPCS